MNTMFTTRQILLHRYLQVFIDRLITAKKGKSIWRSQATQKRVAPREENQAVKLRDLHLRGTGQEFPQIVVKKERIQSINERNQS